MNSVNIVISVISLSNVPNRHVMRDPSYIVSLIADGIEYKTSPSLQGAAMNVTGRFIIPAKISSSFKLRLHCIHQKFRESHIIGETERLNILDTARNQDIVMKWSKPSSKPRDRGLITIHVKVDTSCCPSNAVISFQTTGDFEKLGAMINRLQKQENSPPQWASLLGSLNSLVQLTGSVAEIDPHAKAAFVAVSFAFEMVMRQAMRDAKVNGLVDTMASLYSFLQEAKMLENIAPIERTVTRLVNQTTDCAYFIIEYSKTESFAQRTVMNMISNADALIAGYESSFGELKIEFIMGATLQTTLMTVRILEKVEHIENLIHINELPYMPNASWDPSHTCATGTCKSILEDIEHWIVSGIPRGQDKSCRIYLLLGGPQSGKSSIAHTIAQRYDDKGRLGSGIFLSGKLPGRNRPDMIFSTMARRLTAFDEKIKELISRAIARNPDLPTAVIERQFRDLILKPTQDLTFVGPILIVIDGLGECDPRDRLLRIIAEEFSQLPDNFRILITSRPEPDVKAALKGLDGCFMRRTFLEDGTARNLIAASLSMLEEQNPSIFDRYSKTIVQDQLETRAKGANLWTTTIFKFILIAAHDARRVVRFLENIFSLLSPPDHETTLCHLHRSILFALSPKFYVTNSEIERQGHANINSVSALTDDALEKSTSHGLNFGAHDILRQISCVYDLVDSSEDIYDLIHSEFFKRFIVDKGRYTNDQCYDIDLASGCEAHVEGCLDVLNELLVYDLCHIGNPSLLNSEIPDKEARIELYVPQILQYAIRHWANRLADAQPVASIVDKLRKFLFNHLLHWIELSSFLGLNDAVLTSLEHLDTWLTTRKMLDLNIKAIVYDAICFVQIFSDCISTAALHTYISALIFTPQKTLLHRNYYDAGRGYPELKEGAEESWSYHKTVQIHEYGVQSVVFSHDGLHIVSGCSDNTIHLQDTQKYRIKWILKGHEESVTSVVFSPDDSRIASGSADKTVRVWSTLTGQLVFEAIRGHVAAVRSVAYSPTGSHILSGSDDGEIRIWDTATGQAIGKSFQTLKLSEAITRIVFSPDGLQFATGSNDQSVRVWNLQDRTTVGKSIRHRFSVSDVSWSPDGSLIVTAANKNTVVIWDSTTKEQRTIITCPCRWICCIDFSPDSSKLVGGSDDGLIYVWDVKTGLQLGEPLRGHTKWITSVAVSPDGLKIVSSSNDLTVRVWDITLYHSLHPPTIGISRMKPSHSSTNSHIEMQQADVIIDKDGWLSTFSGHWQRVLWLPPRSRGKMTVHSGYVVIRYTTGRVTWDAVTGKEKIEQKKMKISLERQ